ncbi:MAG: hypothetical protein INR73_08150 [Williamsia sp.]|nr:hypothetical protein [Williamsia sp.]
MKNELIKFFNNNPDFDLKTGNIKKLLADANFAGIAQKDSLASEVKTLNRLHKLTENAAAVIAMRKEGVQSASGLIGKYSRIEFGNQFSAALGSVENALKIYNNALSISNKAKAVLTAYKTRHDIKLYAIDGHAVAPADYEAMFGDGELCECAHCQRVYSPAAYFTDLLKFIKNENPAAYSKLLRRRPDLDDLKLTCKNTNTPLPYIDLVNELLEKKVIRLLATDRLAADAAENYSYQTEGIAAELDAVPEHMEGKAYGDDALKSTNNKTVLSPLLPFDLATEEIRIYTTKLGFSRFDLMERFYGNTDPGKLTDPDLAAERFGFSKAELEVITGKAPFAVSLPGNVKELLALTKLTYVELLQLLETDFLNRRDDEGRQGISVKQEGEGAEVEQLLTCNLEKLFVSGANDAWPSKLVRFARLWKKTGWDIFDLDRALTAINFLDFSGTPERIINNLLIPLSQIEKIRRQLNLPVREALTLVADIDTVIYRDHSKEGQPLLASLYQQLFLNRTFTGTENLYFTKDPHNLSGTVEEQLETISAATGMSAPDMALLVRGEEDLSLQMLSRLYRNVLLAKSLGLTIGDLQKFISIAGMQPEAGIWPASLLNQFIEEWQLFKSACIAIDEYQKVLIANVGDDYQLEVDASLISGINDHIAALNEIRTITDRAEQNRQLDARIDLVIMKISDSAELKASLSKELKAAEDLAIKRLVESYFGEKGKEELFLLTTQEFIDRLTVLQSALEEYLFWKKVPLIFKTFGFDVDEIKWLRANREQTETEMLWRQVIAFDNPATYAACRNLFYLSKLSKAKKPALMPWTALLDIAIQHTDGAKAAFFEGFLKRYAVSENNLVFLAGAKEETGSKGKLHLSFPADFTKAEVLLTIISCSGIMDKLGGSNDQLRSLLNPYSGLDDAQAVKNLLKAKYGNTEWLTVIKPTNDSLRVKRRDALVAWLLANAGEFGWKDTNDLFETLLIDVEMDACMVTSRLKQAINSVQLFIDRCLMDLETGVALNNDFAEQWNTWRKLYRVWEANRKIFLYPENWIEPELRDSKSPFFDELESKLRQNDVTDEIVKDALVTYLEKLDTVANLEMVGLFNDEERGIVHVFGRTHNIPYQYFYRKLEKKIWSPWEKVEVDIEGDHILPVVWNGRLMLFWALFTEKQVEGSTSTYIDPKPGAPDSMVLSSNPAIKYLEMKLAWNEYKSGRWIGKKISGKTISIDNGISIDSHDGNTGEDYTVSYHAAKNDCVLTSLITEEGLFIRLFTIGDFLGPRLQVKFFNSFFFNACNSSPVIEPNINYDGQLHVTSINVPEGTRIDGMSILENQDILKIYNTGIYFNSSYNLANSITILLNKNTGSSRIMPDHHEIEKQKPVIFFFSNQRDVFYVYSRSKFKKDLNEDIINSIGGLKERINTNGEGFSDALSARGERFRSLRQFAGSSTGTNIPGLAEDIPANYSFGESFAAQQFVFSTFYHPYVCEFIKVLNTEGIASLYSQAIQTRVAKNIFNTEEFGYYPQDAVTFPYPVEDLDFSFTGAYALYNWELFFHIPLLLATRLSQNQKFEEARKWFHSIFDPTKSSAGTTGAERFWITKPFKQEVRAGGLSLEEMLSQPAYTEDLNVQLENWEQHPFNPHAVARFRVSAYMRYTVSAYINNLIAWGDNLFQRDTTESINEATLLYILASNILGKKPENVPARAAPAEKSFSEMEGQLDAFSNARVNIESFFTSSGSDNGSDNLKMFLFCLPKNDSLLKYWDTVADRLFKIRHCMNIEGVVRQLPLFEPPIDPALLVKAAAAAFDLNTILNDLNTILPHYRFQVMLQKANELCNDVRALGSELLAVLEKRDAEQLALLRSGHELNMLGMIRDIKEKQREEAKENLNNLIASKGVIEERKNHYSSRLKINGEEQDHINSINYAIAKVDNQKYSDLAAHVFYSSPDWKYGSGFTFGFTWGGTALGNASKAYSGYYSSLVNDHTLKGSLASTYGGYQRRQEDWTFQAKSAELESKQIDKQILAAEIRLAITEKELENHDLQTAQSKEVDDYMRGKFSSAELYDWMARQISAVYFQSYQLAYNMAKKAEKCMQYELGSDGTSYIQFGYWDNLNQGLLSGEKLQYDLRRLENTYLAQNKREFEITKHVSLAGINPFAILQLKETGTCNITLPEELFDMDFPGHYFRRIKSVSISIPCIAGPYTSVNATLRLKTNEYRIDKGATDGNSYEKNTDEITMPGSGRFRSGANPVSAMATSHAQNDSGVFELNFRDERYLPFEGAGAVSSWQIELNGKYKNPDESVLDLSQLDFDSISDVILHMKYTAKEGSENFKFAALGNLTAVINEVVGTGMPLSILFDAKHELSDQWYRFTNAAGANNVLELAVSKDMLPFFAAKKNVEVSQVTIFAKKKNESDEEQIPFNTAAFLVMDNSVKLFKKEISNLAAIITAESDFVFLITMDETEVVKLENLFLLVNYKLS